MFACQTAASSARALLGAVALTSLASLSAASAAPAPPTALPGFPSLYESVRTKECPASGSCVVAFEVVPAGRLLQATNLTCFTTTIGVNPVDFAAYRVFETKLATVPIEKAAFPATDVNTDSNNTAVFAINEQIRLSFRSARFPRVSVAAAGTFDFFIKCTLSGDLK
jgi:hypothetical protein